MWPVNRSTDRGAGLADHHVEQVVGIVEATLGVAGQLRAELVCDVRQRALEVGRELSRIPAGCTAGHTIALDEDHAAVARAQDEERRGNPGNPRTHDGDISRRVRMKRLRWRPSAAS